MSWCGGGDINDTPGVEQRTRAIRSLTLSNRSISWSGGPLGQADAIFSAVVDNDEGQYQFDGNNDLTGFENLYPGSRTAPPEPASFDIGSASNVESGSDALTFMRWGRWSGGTATITLTGSGTDVSQDLGNQSLHWISNPEWVAPPVMPVSGVATYSLIGSTSPTDGAGSSLHTRCARSRRL